MSLFKIGLNHLPQMLPFFIKLHDHWHFLTCLSATQVVGTIGDLPVNIWKGVELIAKCSELL